MAKYNNLDKYDAAQYYVKQRGYNRSRNFFAMKIILREVKTKLNETNTLTKLN